MSKEALHTNHEAPEAHRVPIIDVNAAEKKAADDAAQAVVQEIVEGSIAPENLHLGTADSKELFPDLERVHTVALNPQLRPIGRDGTTKPPEGVTVVHAQPKAKPVEVDSPARPVDPDKELFKGMTIVPGGTNGAEQAVAPSTASEQKTAAAVPDDLWELLSLRIDAIKRDNIGKAISADQIHGLEALVKQELAAENLSDHFDNVMKALKEEIADHDRVNDRPPLPPVNKVETVATPASGSIPDLPMTAEVLTPEQEAADRKAILTNFPKENPAGARAFRELDKQVIAIMEAQIKTGVPATEELFKPMLVELQKIPGIPLPIVELAQMQWRKNLNTVNYGIERNRVLAKESENLMNLLDTKLQQATGIVASDIMENELQAIAKQLGDESYRRALDKIQKKIVAHNEQFNDAEAQKAVLSTLTQSVNRQFGALRTPGQKEAIDEATMTSFLEKIRAEYKAAGQEAAFPATEKTLRGYVETYNNALTGTNEINKNSDLNKLADNAQALLDTLTNKHATTVIGSGEVVQLLKTVEQQYKDAKQEAEFGRVATELKNMVAEHNQAFANETVGDLEDRAQNMLDALRDKHFDSAISMGEVAVLLDQLNRQYRNANQVEHFASIKKGIEDHVKEHNSYFANENAPAAQPNWDSLRPSDEAMGLNPKASTPDQPAANAPDWDSLRPSDEALAASKAYMDARNPNRPQVNEIKTDLDDRDPAIKIEEARQQAIAELVQSNPDLIDSEKALLTQRALELFASTETKRPRQLIEALKASLGEREKINRQISALVLDAPAIAYSIHSALEATDKAAGEKAFREQLLKLPTERARQAALQLYRAASNDKNLQSNLTLLTDRLTDRLADAGEIPLRELAIQKLANTLASQINAQAKLRRQASPAAQNIVTDEPVVARVSTPTETTTTVDAPVIAAVAEAKTTEAPQAEVASANTSTETVIPTEAANDNNNAKESMTTEQAVSLMRERLQSELLAKSTGIDSLIAVLENKGDTKAAEALRGLQQEVMTVASNAKFEGQKRDQWLNQIKQALAQYPQAYEAVLPHLAAYVVAHNGRAQSAQADLPSELRGAEAANDTEMDAVDVLKGQTTKINDILVAAKSSHTAIDMTTLDQALAGLDSISGISAEDRALTEGKARQEARAWNAELVRERQAGIAKVEIAVTDMYRDPESKAQFGKLIEMFQAYPEVSNPLKDLAIAAAATMETARNNGRPVNQGEMLNLATGPLSKVPLSPEVRSMINGKLIKSFDTFNQSAVA